VARKSLLEDILEGSFKNPVVGVVMSVLFIGIGAFLSHKAATMSTVPVNAAFRPLYQMLSSVLYIGSVVTLIVTLIGYFFVKSKKKKQAAFFDSKDALEDLRSMPWQDFEHFVGELFTRLSYSIEVTGGPGDGGVDLIVSKEGRRYLVQCKKYREWKVSLSQVRDFYGAMTANRSINVGYFVTTGIFTLEAIRFAEDKNIDLIDGSRLIDLMKTANMSTEPRSDISPVSQTPE
jgi:restriction system protein